MADKKALLADNPHDAESFRKMADDGRRFLVVHAGVGPFREGSVVSARDLGPGAEMPRLVALGALREMSPEEINLYEDALTAPGDVPPPVIQPTGGAPVVPEVKVPEALKPANPSPTKA